MGIILIFELSHRQTKDFYKAKKVINNKRHILMSLFNAVSLYLMRLICDNEQRFRVYFLEK